jgi:hypothetical protein
MVSGEPEVTATDASQFGLFRERARSGCVQGRVPFVTDRVRASVISQLLQAAFAAAHHDVLLLRQIAGADDADLGELLDRVRR